MTTEQDKANKDLLLFGQSFMLDGKHIPLDNVLINPKMTTNNEAFEKFFPRPFKFSDKAHELETMSKWNDAKIIWEQSIDEATTEANKRIAELELQLQNWKDFSKKVQKIDFNDYLELQASNNRLQAKLTAEKEYINKLLKSSNHLFVENEQLKAHINNLREAFNDLAAIVNHGSPSCQKGVVEKCKCTTCVIDRVTALKEVK